MPAEGADAKRKREGSLSPSKAHAHADDEGTVDDGTAPPPGKRVLPPRRREQAQYFAAGPAAGREVKRKRPTLQHEDFCYMCDSGGELLCCGQCPKVYHTECVGLTKVPTGAWTCPWHACAECDKTTSVAGGLLFRCTDCPTAYCFDCSPQGMARVDPSDSFISAMLARGWDLTKQREQRSFFLCSQVTAVGFERDLPRMHAHVPLMTCRSNPVTAISRICMPTCHS
jgi:hypothetical protein